VRPVQRDELPADALQLRQRERRSRQLDGLFEVREGQDATFFAGVVFLPGEDLRENVLRGFVELVEVVLLCGGFLEDRTALVMVHKRQECQGQIDVRAR